MIDSQKLAEFALEEARIFAKQVEFNDEPNLSADGKFDRYCRDSPFPPPEELARVIEEVFWASLLTEEGRPCRPRLFYAPTSAVEGDPVVSFEIPVALNRASLRKLSPAHGDSGFVTWRLFADELPMITGIRSHGGWEHLVVAGPGSGAVDVIWQGCRLLTFHSGKLLRRSQSRLPALMDAIRFLMEHVFEGYDIPHCVHIVLGIAKLGHGGSLWIVREGRPLDGLRIGHALASSRPLLERLADNYEERERRLSSFAHLSAVDGALLLDSRCRPLGFGVFADADKSIAGAKPLVSRLLAHGSDQIAPETLGGGRHRSAVEFCRQFAPAAAFVVSQDGRITLVVGDRAGEVSCAEIVSLGHLLPA